MREDSPVIALTMGDPAGIGPEITANLIKSGGLDGLKVLVIGSAGVLVDCLGDKAPAGTRIFSYRELQEKEDLFFPAVIDTSEGKKPSPGMPSAASGEISGRAVETAISVALAGLVDGIVTGPVSKEALFMAGYAYRGHTDMLADKFDAPDCQMMMVDGGLRIVIMTRDIPLREVPDAITPGRIINCVRVTERALMEFWAIEDPLIAVAALNPHAGDGGITGREEMEVIEPALKAMSGEGVRIDGPVPADTLFHNWRGKPYHAYIALYHDQGMIPFKTMGFDEGVNMTIGLPVVRTSVCHGTAYDLVGRGKASTGSLEAALSLAVECCRARKRRVNVEK